MNNSNTNDFTEMRIISSFAIFVAYYGFELWQVAGFTLAWHAAGLQLSET